MKFRLGAFENSRTFYSPQGSQTIIRDTVINQSILPELVKEVMEEYIPEIIEEPIIEEQPISSKTKRGKQ